MSSTLITAKYDEVKANVAKHLTSADTQPSFTTDALTASNNVEFSTVTLHYMDIDFNAINRCLAVRNTPGSHTAKVLAEHTSFILGEFGMQLDKAVYIVTDNASNIKVAMTKLLQNVKWRPCFTHTLQLMIITALDNKDVFLEQDARESSFVRRTLPPQSVSDRRTDDYPGRKQFSTAQINPRCYDPLEFPIPDVGTPS